MNLPRKIGPAPRPTEVLVLGGIGLSVGMNLVSLGMSAFKVLPMFLGEHRFPRGVSHILLFCLLQIPVSAVGCIAGIGLLCRREWGRFALEIVCYIAFVLVMLISMLLMYSYTSWKSRQGWDADGVVGVMFGFIVGIFSLSFPLIMIHYLRSDRVRNAMIQE